MYISGQPSDSHFFRARWGRRWRAQLYQNQCSGCPWSGPQSVPRSSGYPPRCALESAISAAAVGSHLLRCYHRRAVCRLGASTWWLF